ncbi:NUDIX hydrolase [Curtobacterium sp. MCPF17_052]|uniref:NUDIX hydrolase n=1 Tax=Curtobacterium sp. MCPF17_052 TaxID=2175655 RepID=UPI00346428DA
MEYTDYDTRLASYAVVTDGDRVLLARLSWPDAGLWTLPGGGVELDETVEEGAVREVLEETGYDVVVEELLGVRSHVVPPERRKTRNGRPMKAVQVVHRARVVGGSAAPRGRGDDGPGGMGADRRTRVAPPRAARGAGTAVGGRHGGVSRASPRLVSADPVGAARRTGRARPRWLRAPRGAAGVRLRGPRRTRHRGRLRRPRVRGRR